MLRQGNEDACLLEENRQNGVIFNKKETFWRKYKSEHGFDLRWCSKKPFWYLAVLLGGRAGATPREYEPVMMGHSLRDQMGTGHLSTVAILPSGVASSQLRTGPSLAGRTHKDGHWYMGVVGGPAGRPLGTECLGNTHLGLSRPGVLQSV